MKLAFLFADSHHTLHLVNGRVPFHKPTEAELEAAAFEIARGLQMEVSVLQFVGALKNGVLAGPEWFEPRALQPPRDEGKREDGDG